MITLIRERDNKTIKGSRLKWVEWNEAGNAMYDEPKIGYSLMIDPSINWTWLTTEVTEIIENNKNCVKFKTKNSTYTLKV